MRAYDIRGVVSCCRCRHGRLSATGRWLSQRITQQPSQSSLCVPLANPWDWSLALSDLSEKNFVASTVSSRMKRQSRLSLPNANSVLIVILSRRAPCACRIGFASLCLAASPRHTVHPNRRDLVGYTNACSSATGENLSKRKINMKKKTRDKRCLRGIQEETSGKYSQEV